MNNATIAADLTAHLDLETPPVALAFLDEPPAGVPANQPVAPSACTFWRRAETEAFFVPAEAHFNCPIGAMVMGFDLPAAVSEELMGLVGRMSECGYVDASEAAKIPVNKKGRKGILYGPLARFPGEPDAVLVWLTPLQAMIWSEAAGGATWGGNAPTTVFGRPGCAAIPSALGEGRPTLSFGCIGMRTFTEIAPDRMLAVMPAAELPAFARALAGKKDVNAAMRSFYEERKAATTGAA